MTREPLDWASLKAAIEAGEDFAYLLFWGHRPRSDGKPSPSCLSQWFDASFELEGDTYPTAEHYMMAEKARLFGDEETRAAILAAADPGKAKALGRQVRDFDEATWRAARFDIVVRGNRAKFGQNEAIRYFLLGTRHKVLVEASPRDRIWGIGLGADDPRAERPHAWQGENLLGFALMSTRAALRDSP